jgi:exopolysaccharide biosynthesis polyprenyl glycosylphosphotransferase
MREPNERSAESLDAPVEPVSTRRSGAPSEWKLVIGAMAADGAVLFAGFLGAHWLRLSTGLFQGTPAPIRSEHFATLVLLLPIWILIHGMNGLYRPRVIGTILDQGAGLLKAVSLGCLLVLALGFATRTNYFFERRLVLGLAWFATLLLSGVVRLGVIRRLYLDRHLGGRRPKRIIVVGAGVEGRGFLERTLTNVALHYEVVAFADDDRAKVGTEIDGIPILGGVDDLPRISQEVRADQIFVAIPSLGQQGTLALMSRCMQAQLPVRHVNDILHLILSDTQVQTVDGIPTDDIRADGGPQLSLFIKRAFDLVVSVSLLVALFPLFLFISLMIKVFSPGPVMFKQVRAGRFGREFTMCKFRTMKLQTDDSIHREYATRLITGEDLEYSDRRSETKVFKMTRDPRVTPFGWVLRRTSLDELPQLLNVVAGDMSIVGPRPPIFYELNHYKEWHRKRLRVKPGLTGLWQVSGRSSVPFDEMVLLDLYYIDHWSLKTDLEILFRTIPAVLSGEGAY